MYPFFDLNSPENFFISIIIIFNRYNDSKAKEIEDLMYVIMGLNHLREWIAPNYNPNNSPTTPLEQFSKDIYNDPNFEIIRRLCNHSKHFNRNIQTSCDYGLDFDDWPDVDAVKDFDKGPPTNFFVDGQNIIEIINPIIDFYKNNWLKAANNRIFSLIDKI